MTDREKLTALLDEWRVPYRDDGNVMVGYEPGMPPDLRERAYDSAQVDGYMGFYTRFEFTEAGEFVKMGAWE